VSGAILRYVENCVSKVGGGKILFLYKSTYYFGFEGRKCFLISLKLLFLSGA
jgi:hypothetical protein